MPVITTYAGQTNSTRRLSGNLWKNFDFARHYHEPGASVFIFDDFHNFAQEISAQNVAAYASYIDTGVTLTQLATERIGVMQVAGNDADNDEGHLTTGGNTGVCGVISTTAGEDHPLWFEARFRVVTSVADNAVGLFVGMGEEAQAAAGALVANTGEIGSKDMIGFQILCADGDAMKFVYRKAGQGKQTVLTWGTALVANTWYNVGFKYNPKAIDAEKISVYINNTLQSSYVTATNLAAATFPNGEELAMLFATIVGEAAENKIDLDFWAMGQGIEY